MDAKLTQSRMSRGTRTTWLAALGQAEPPVGSRRFTAPFRTQPCDGVRDGGIDGIFRLAQQGSDRVAQIHARRCWRDRDIAEAHRSAIAPFVDWLRNRVGPVRTGVRGARSHALQYWFVYTVKAPEGTSGIRSRVERPRGSESDGSSESDRLVRFLGAEQPPRCQDKAVGCPAV